MHFQKLRTIFSALRDGFLIFITIVSVSVFCLWSIYRLSYDANIESVRAELKRVARIASQMVDGDRHQDLIKPEQLNTSLYKELVAPLVRFHLAMPDIRYIYTMRIIDGKLFIILDTSNDVKVREFRPGAKPSTLMELYSEDPDEEERLLIATTVVRLLLLRSLLVMPLVYF